MPSVESLIMNDPVRLIEWGVSGAGKTILGASAVKEEEFRPMYVMDWDKRIASIQSVIPREYWKYIEVDTYRDDKVQGEAFALMQAKIDRLEGLGFKSVMVDSMSFMMTGLMNRVLMLDGKPSTQVPQLQHYNAQKSLAIDVISRLCSKKFHVIVTAHEDTDKDEVTGRMFKALDLTGKLAGKMPGYFNEFWHIEIQQTTGKDPAFMVRTRGDMIYAARTAYKLDPLEPAGTIWAKIAKQRAENMKKGEETISNNSNSVAIPIATPIAKA